jgi:hypothetical protein
MANLMNVQIAILKQVGNRQMINNLVMTRGAYLRQLAYGVINNSYSIEVASRLLLNY